jgi:hypothetical protein
MNHEYAIASQYPERYAYGDLRADERDDFEEHLADCSRCFHDVTEAQAFAANVRAVFREQVAIEKIKETEHRFFTWLPFRKLLAFSGGLNLALAGAAAYTFVAILPGLRTEIQQLERPSVTSTFVVPGESRGAVPTFTVAKNSFAHFRIDVPKRFDHYQCTVETQAGGDRKTYNLPKDGDSETLDLTVPVAGLEPGDYKLQVSGSSAGHSEVLASFTLRVTAQR